MKIQICTECCIDLTVHPMSKNSWRADFLVGSTTCTLGFWIRIAMLYNKRCWGLITAGKWQPDCRWGCSVLWGRGCCETSLQYSDDRDKLLSFWSFLTERKARKFPTAKHFGASHNELLIFHLHPNGNLKHIVPMTKEVQSRKSAICGHDYKGKKKCILKYKQRFSTHLSDENYTILLEENCRWISIGSIPKSKH